MSDMTDRIEFIVRQNAKGFWEVVSAVMTSFGSKKAENFMIEYENKEVAEAFALGCRTIEAGRTPKELTPWIDAVRRELDSIERGL